MTDDVVNDEGGSTEAPSWMWDENTSGTGERPEYLAAKFKSVADAAKSYNELEKKLGSAPKEYNFDASSSWLDPSFEPLQEAAKFAKEKHVSQDVVDKILGAATQYIDNASVDMEAEKAKLGADASDRINVIDNWAKSNFSESTYKALTDTLDTAEAVIAVEEIRAKMDNDNITIPSSNDSVSSAGLSMDEVQAEMLQNLDAYKNDPKYRRELQQKIEQASKQSNFIDKY